MASSSRCEFTSAGQNPAVLQYLILYRTPDRARDSRWKEHQRHPLQELSLYIELSMSYIAYGAATVVSGGPFRQGSPRMSGNHHSRPPAYKRIQSQIRDRIASAGLKPGDAVASERELAKTHKVSLMTARHAFASLGHEGVGEAGAGGGTFA